MSSRHPIFQTNYLKTNLLKQIKKISLFAKFQYHVAKGFNLLTLQRYELFKYIASFLSKIGNEIDLYQSRCLTFSSDICFLTT